MICARCGDEVPTRHAHKYGLNGYRCQPPPTKQPKDDNSSTTERGDAE